VIAHILVIIGRAALLGGMLAALLSVALPGGLEVVHLRGAEAPLAHAAPMQVQVGEIAFSPSVNPLALPVGAAVQYPSGTKTIWASFEFDGYTNERIEYMLQANGNDFQWGRLDCCTGPVGRYAFAISRPSGRLLGGAAYRLIVYANDAEIAHGGFGINGIGGFDSNDNDQ